MDGCQAPLEVFSADELEQLIALTLQASPTYVGMIDQRERVPRLRPKTLYLLRDILKVVGAQQEGLAQATLGVFFANAQNRWPEGLATQSVCASYRGCLRCSRMSGWPCLPHGKPPWLSIAVSSLGLVRTVVYRICSRRCLASSRSFEFKKGMTAQLS